MTVFDSLRWRRIRPILDRVLEVPAAERHALLDEACAGDVELRAELELVLRVDAEAGGVLGAPTGPFLERFAERVEIERTRSHATSLATATATAERLLRRMLRERVEERRFLPGTLVARRYRIVGLAGRGGMGEVYRADDLRLGQPVALKFLPAGLERDPRWRERLLDEVKLARQVAHPNVCRVYDAGEAAGRQFISMEYVDGEDLASLLRRIGRVPGEKALEIARQLCAGIAAIHGLGILHRDLKPANVMLDGRGRVRVTDFGLAVLAGTEEGAGAGAGTPAYMAPEQLEGREATVRTDLYALGLLLYELFTGRRPFAAPSPEEERRLKGESAPARPSSLVENLEPAVERMILRCLEGDPARRPASALGVAAALPGGDPLAAALAAGETPSPDIVAAAGDEGTLSVRAASLLLAAVAAVLALVVVLCDHGIAYNVVPMDRSPEVLRARALEIADRLGYTGKPADDASWLWIAQETVDRLSDGRTPRQARRELARAVDGPVRFVYRASPRRMRPLRWQVGHPAYVDWDNPPPRWTGEFLAQTDEQGRLRLFHAIATERDEAPRPAPEPDRLVLFDVAGLDPADFDEVAPTWVPDVPFDRRVEWAERDRDRGRRIAAASFRDRFVYFNLYEAWERPWRDEPPSEAPLGRLLWGWGFFASSVTGLALARRNLLAGRGDRRGARRLAVACGLAYGGFAGLGGHGAGGLQAAESFVSTAVSAGAPAGVIAWALYLALEPYVRRRMPRLLVSWSRLLGGELGDPLVGRHVLLGLLLGGIMAFGVLLPGALPSWLDAGAVPWAPLAESVGRGLRALLSETGTQALDGVSAGLALTMIFYVSKVVLRWDWLAAVPPTLLLVATYPGPSEGLPLVLPLFLLWSVFLLRFGVLTICVGFAVVQIFLAVPVTSDPSRWNFDGTVVVLGTLGAAAFYAFRSSLGPRRHVRG